MRKIVIASLILLSVSGCASQKNRTIAYEKDPKFIRFVEGVEFQSGGKSLLYKVLPLEQSNKMIQQCGTKPANKGTSFVEIVQSLEVDGVLYNTKMRIFPDSPELQSLNTLKFGCPSKKLNHIVYGFWDSKFFGLLIES